MRKIPWFVALAAVMALFCFDGKAAAIACGGASDSGFTGGYKWDAVNQPALAEQPAPFNAMRASNGSPFSCTLNPPFGAYWITTKQDSRGATHVLRQREWYRGPAIGRYIPDGRVAHATGDRSSSRLHQSVDHYIYADKRQRGGEWHSSRECAMRRMCEDCGREFRVRQMASARFCPVCRTENNRAKGWNIHARKRRKAESTIRMATTLSEFCKHGDKNQNIGAI
jgi:hypothetical protein